MAAQAARRASWILCWPSMDSDRSMIRISAIFAAGAGVPPELAWTVISASARSASTGRSSVASISMEKPSPARVPPLTGSVIRSNAEHRR